MIAPNPNTSRQAGASTRPPEPTYGPGRSWADTPHFERTRDLLEDMEISGEPARLVLWLAENLYANGYVLTADLAVVVAGAIFTAQVLMLKGVPGCGKTYLAEVINRVFCPDLPLLKVEGHEEVTVESLLYKQDEVGLRMWLELSRGSVSGREDIVALVEEARKRFVHYGPLVESIVYGRDHGSRRPILIDELVKFRPEAEAFLLSWLNDFSVSISHMDLYFRPEPGREPIPIVTANELRALQQPTERRAVVVAVKTPLILDEDEVLCQKVPHLTPMCRYFVLLLAMRIRHESLGLEKPLSISEVIDLAQATAFFNPRQLTLSFFQAHVNYLAKNWRDQFTLGRKMEMCFDWAAAEIKRCDFDERRVYHRLYELHEQQSEARRKRDEDLKLT